jgi:hypothetical protein
MAQTVRGGDTSTGDITLAVATTGNDTDTTRPKRIVSGDWSAKPFATIQAAIDALPKLMQHNTAINVSAGSYSGFNVSGFVNNSFLPSGFKINGSRAAFVPATGSGSGTATSGTNRTITLTGAGWTVDDFVGKYLRITAGTGAGLILIIAKNTTDTITVAAKASPVLDGTSQFVIEDISVIINTAASSSSVPCAVSIQKNVGHIIYVWDIKVSGVTVNTGFYAAYNHSSSFRRCVAQATLAFGFSCGVGWGTSLNNCAAIGASSVGFNSQGTTFCGYAAIGNLAKSCGEGFDINESTASYFYNGNYARDCSSYGLWLENVGRIQVTDWIIDSCGTGIRSLFSKIDLRSSDISNCTQPFSLKHTGMIVSGYLTGTGNAGWGLNATGTDNVIEITGFNPTITGVSGEVTVDGTTDVTWASLASSGNYALDMATGARVNRQ